jgi:hypothetical protein
MPEGLEEIWDDDEDNGPDAEMFSDHHSKNRPNPAEEKKEDEEIKKSIEQMSDAEKRKFWASRRADRFKR